MWRNGSFGSRLGPITRSCDIVCLKLLAQMLLQKRWRCMNILLSCCSVTIHRFLWTGVVKASVRGIPTENMKTIVYKQSQCLAQLSKQENKKMRHKLTWTLNYLHLYMNADHQLTTHSNTNFKKGIKHEGFFDTGVCTHCSLSRINIQ